MAQVKVYYDRHANTLTVWFGNPQSEAICEEAGDGVILMKDRRGKVIGFEKISFVPDGESPLHVGFEAVGV